MSKWKMTKENLTFNVNHSAFLNTLTSVNLLGQNISLNILHCANCFLFVCHSQTNIESQKVLGEIETVSLVNG